MTTSDHDDEPLRGICELTLETRSIGELEAFYVEVLGMRVIDRSDDRVWLAVDRRTRLGLWSPGEKEFDDRGGRHVHFALSVAPGRLDALAARARERGAEPHGPIEHEGGDRSLYLRDPAGNVVEAWDYFEHAEGAREGVDALAG
jgi:catechol-2,3-dioxygenase